MSQSRGRWDMRLRVSEAAGGCQYGARAGSDHGDHCGNNGRLGRCDDWKARTSRSPTGEGAGHYKKEEEEEADNCRRRHNHRWEVVVGDSCATRSGVGPPPGEGGSIVTW